MIENVNWKINLTPPFTALVEDKITVRDQMAMAALVGMDVSFVGNTPKMVARRADAIADAMMNERKEQTK